MKNFNKENVLFVLATITMIASVSWLVRENNRILRRLDAAKVETARIVAEREAATLAWQEKLGTLELQDANGNRTRVPYTVTEGSAEVPFTHWGDDEKARPQPGAHMGIRIDYDAIDAAAERDAAAVVDALRKEGKLPPKTVAPAPQSRTYVPLGELAGLKPLDTHRERSAKINAALDRLETQRRLREAADKR